VAKEAFFELKENASPDVDRLTWTDYEADLERKRKDRHDRVEPVHVVFDVLFANAEDLLPKPLRPRKAILKRRG
jgi:ATP-dependent DNA ligase